MKPLVDPQELARRNNEAAAVHHDRVQRRRWRKRNLKPATRLDQILDELERQEAERLARPVRAVGFFLPRKS